MNGPQMFSGATNSTFNGGTFNNINSHGPQTFQRGLDILDKYIAPGAFHNSAERFDPPKCYPKTREAIEAKIMAWVEERPENLDRLVLWLYGPAGAGKSAIAQTIAELCASLMLLAASFFFSRTTAGRNDSSRLVATLTSQLIQSIPEIREPILTLIEGDPTVFYRTPETQMKTLIVDALNQVPQELLEQRPRLVIIDGLDECLPPKSQNDILKFLSTSLEQLNTPLYFLIASRPQPNIRDTFVSYPLRGMTRTLALTDDYESTEDIRYFLTSSFHDIRSRNRYLPTSWPQNTDIDNLVERSSGQFIFAATVIRYVAGGGHGHEKRLTTVLALRSSDTDDTPFAMLDAFYLQIFFSVADNKKRKVLEILTAMICLYISQLEALEELFDYRPGELESVMEDMHSLVYIPATERGEVKIYHASLPDFLLDPARSRSFYLDPAARCLNLARLCIKSNRFRPSAILNLEHLDPQYVYARTFSRCIIASPLTEELRNFLFEFSFWDWVPPQFSLLIHSEICDMSMELLDTFYEWHQDSYPGWDQIYGGQLHHFDVWIYQTFSSVPEHLRPMVLTACSIYIWLSVNTKNLSDAFHIAMLKYILTHLGLELGGIYDTWNSSIRIRTPEFITFVLQRIPIIFGPQFHVADYNYTDFAIWCSLRVCENTRELDFPLYGGRDISKFGMYLTVALKHCQKSRELVNILKGEKVELARLNQRFFKDIFNISKEFEQYIQNCERFFNERFFEAQEGGETSGSFAYQVAFVNQQQPHQVEAHEEEDNNATCAHQITFISRQEYHHVEPHEEEDINHTWSNQLTFLNRRKPHQGFRRRLHTIKKAIARHFHLG